MTTRAVQEWIEVGTATDPGRDPHKQVNEDTFAHGPCPVGYLLAVFDGMGGHAGGKEAAEVARDTVVEAMNQAVGAPGDSLVRAIELANTRVVRMEVKERGARPGATAVCAVVHAAGVDVAHAGDSRAYWVHDDQIFALTKDHSMVQELVKVGVLSPHQAAHHPDAHQILRAVGIQEKVTVELRPEPVRYDAGDRLVLCSDGLSDLVADHEILEKVRAHPPQGAAQALVELANERGGHDNITVLVAHLREACSAAPVKVSPTLVDTSEAAAARSQAVKTDGVEGAGAQSESGAGVGADDRLPRSGGVKTVPLSVAPPSQLAIPTLPPSRAQVELNPEVQARVLTVEERERRLFRTLGLGLGALGIVLAAVAFAMLQAGNTTTAPTSEPTLNVRERGESPTAAPAASGSSGWASSADSATNSRPGDAVPLEPVAPPTAVPVDDDGDGPLPGLVAPKPSATAPAKKPKRPPAH
jgi:protein phosphatase